MTKSTLGEWVVVACSMYWVTLDKLAALSLVALSWMRAILKDFDKGDFNTGGTVIVGGLGVWKCTWDEEVCSLDGGIVYLFIYLLVNRLGGI